ncbi:hypothetical protein LCGC14_2101410 [marine sediment metagenome]|uniref:Uncharacterized protein n=1 Tax=marine sediment metagenome TaxID=412755 RepID=A0A0F9E9Q6_9ZZZZ
MNWEKTYGKKISIGQHKKASEARKELCAPVGKERQTGTEVVARQVHER